MTQTKKSHETYQSDEKIRLDDFGAGQTRTSNRRFYGFLSRKVL